MRGADEHEGDLTHEPEVDDAPFRRRGRRRRDVEKRLAKERTKRERQRAIRTAIVAITGLCGVIGMGVIFGLLTGSLSMSTFRAVTDILYNPLIGLLGAVVGTLGSSYYQQ